MKVVHPDTGVLVSNAKAQTADPGAALASLRHAMLGDRSHTQTLLKKMLKNAIVCLQILHS